MNKTAGKKRAAEIITKLLKKHGKISIKLKFNGLGRKCRKLNVLGDCKYNWGSGFLHKSMNTSCFAYRTRLSPASTPKKMIQYDLDVSCSDTKVSYSIFAKGKKVMELTIKRRR